MSWLFYCLYFWWIPFEIQRTHPESTFHETWKTYTFSISYFCYEKLSLKFECYWVSTVVTLFTQIIHKSLQKQCLLNMEMETTTGTKSTITIFDRASSHTQNSSFQHSHHHWLFIFSSCQQGPACSLIIICMTIRDMACLSHCCHHC